jgi:hypothetical protein
MAGCHFKIIQKGVNVPDFPPGRGAASGCHILPVAGCFSERNTDHRCSSGSFPVTTSYAAVCTLRTVRGLSCGDYPGQTHLNPLRAPYSTPDPIVERSDEGPQPDREEQKWSVAQCLSDRQVSFSSEFRVPINRGRLSCPT